MGQQKITVAELFAGVGGFRLGLEGHPESDEDTGFRVVFSNQWEPPGSGRQWASEIYEMHFGKEAHYNEDIHDIAYNEGDMAATIRDRVHEHDLLVGGFPCQDYSVARTISGELGIKGEKGKLWVPIRNIIRHKRPRPKVVLLENVPRLLNSPANARGLNFAIILNDLISMGYEVEWRVINAADYDMPQQRSRVFIVAYRTPGPQGGSNQSKINGPERFGFSGTKSKGAMSKWLLNSVKKSGNPKWKTGPFAQAFPVTGELDKLREVEQDVGKYSSKSSAFGNAGFAYRKRSMIDGKPVGPRINVFWTTKVKADYEGEKQTLSDVLEENFDKKYEVDASRIDEWNYAKGSKNEFRLRKRDRDGMDREMVELYDQCMNAPFSERAVMWTQYRSRFKEHVRDDGFYHYDEGTMGLDRKNSPSRTVVTAEIGTSPSRMRHIFEDSPGRFRRLSPIETERLNMFPDDWTKIDGIKDSRRGFLMGNALVVGIIERLRKPLRELILDRS